jgi:hypothetical protein
MSEVPRHWIRTPQRWAIDQERDRHLDALYQWGEYAIFVLLWNIVDFEAGLVDRCPTCYIPYGKITDAYGQAAQERCPDCYGTTFEGGYRAVIVRPSLWRGIGADESNPEAPRGTTFISTHTIQSTYDFLMRSRDYVFRGDGSRWIISGPADTNLATGFEVKTYPADTIDGWNIATARQEDKSSVAYDIRPPEADLIGILNLPVEVRLPIDFLHGYDDGYEQQWDVEEIRGPLR